MLENIVILSLVVGAGFWILAPLIRRNRVEISSASEIENRLRELNLKKEGVYTTIKELEFDLSMGKLSKEDFETLRGQYTHDALGYMEKIDRIRAGREEEGSDSEKRLLDQVEREISSLREKRTRNKKTFFCSQCSSRLKPGTRFCTHCGTPVAGA